MRLIASVVLVSVASQASACVIAFVHTMDVAPKRKIVIRRVGLDVSVDRWTYSQWIA